MTTKVVHCKREKYDVYIGRGRGGAQTKWGNPFPLESEAHRDDCILEYIHHLQATGLWRDAHELRGKTLGCWCKPRACHGDVLAALADVDDPEERLARLEVVYARKAEGEE